MPNAFPLAYKQNVNSEITYNDKNVEVFGLVSQFTTIKNSSWPNFLQRKTPYRWAQEYTMKWKDQLFHPKLDFYMCKFDILLLKRCKRLVKNQKLKDCTNFLPDYAFVSGVITATFNHDILCFVFVLTRHSSRNKLAMHRKIRRNRTIERSVTQMMKQASELFQLRWSRSWSELYRPPSRRVLQKPTVLTCANRQYFSEGSNEWVHMQKSKNYYPYFLWLRVNKNLHSFYSFFHKFNCL